jgi:hypothetical protein
MDWQLGLWLSSHESQPLPKCLYDSDAVDWLNALLPKANVFPIKKKVMQVHCFNDLKLAL